MTTAMYRHPLTWTRLRSRRRRPPSVSATGQATGLTIGNARIVAAAASGAADTALLTVIAAPPPPLAQPDVRFSEIQHDNASADVGEAIEIAGSAGTGVTGWRILLYNGNGGAVYNTKSLTGVLPSRVTDAARWR